jgi:hypothetical protein
MYAGQLLTQLVMHSQWIIVIQGFYLAAFAGEAPMILICRIVVRTEKTLESSGTQHHGSKDISSVGVLAAVRWVQSAGAAAPPQKSPAIDGHRRTPPAGARGSWRRVQSDDKPASLPIIVHERTQRNVSGLDGALI